MTQANTGVMRFQSKTQHHVSVVRKAAGRVDVRPDTATKLNITNSIKRLSVNQITCEPNEVITESK